MKNKFWEEIGNISLDFSGFQRMKCWKMTEKILKLWKMSKVSKNLKIKGSWRKSCRRNLRKDITRKKWQLESLFHELNIFTMIKFATNKLNEEYCKILIIFRDSNSLYCFISIVDRLVFKVRTHQCFMIFSMST